jgi:hypothetical protein
MKGSGKVHTSLIPEEKKKKSSVYIAKPKKSFKLKSHIKSRGFKTLKKKIEKEVNDSDYGQIKSYKLCLAFIERFLEKYEIVMNSGNTEKETNYSLFATMLAANLSQVNEEYDEIIDESEFLNNNNNNNNVINVLARNPYDYLENYVEYVEDEDVLGDYEKVIDKYFNSLNKSKMVFNNNNNNKNKNDVEQEYLSYSSFIRDSVNAVKETIKNYSSELKTKKKIANNVNIDDLIMGLTAVKIKGNKNNIKPNVKTNVVLNNDFLNKFMKLGF